MPAVSARSIADWFVHRRQSASGRPAAAVGKTIDDYLAERLSFYGVEHIFGIPGDYCVTLYHDLEVGGLVKPVNTCDEQGAGFAADVYARTRGLGACCFTYAVGAFKAINTTAEAYAEKSPVVVISGAPGVRERARGPLLHHVVKGFDTQRRIYQEITVDSAVLDNPATAFADIDRVLASALRHKRPVYLEIPRDQFHAIGEPEHVPADYRPPASNQEALVEAVGEAATLLARARQPVILAGEDLQRHGLRDSFVQLVEATGIPFATTLLAKGLVSERHPLCMGVYDGALARPEVRAYVEASDCLVMLGVMLTDINLGLFTATIDPGRSIDVGAEKATIFHHHYDNVQLSDFLVGLSAARMPSRTGRDAPGPTALSPFVPRSGQTITAARLFEAINGFIDDDTVVITDTGETLIAGADLLIHAEAEYFAPAFYTSVGFAVPAALGAQLANPARRPLVLCGDAAFQMTGVELSTMARYGLTPIVVVMNNGGYGSERPLHAGPFLDVARWRYDRLPSVIGAGKGFRVETEDGLSRALDGARAYTDGPAILDVQIAEGDYTAAFTRFLDLFAKGVR